MKNIEEKILMAEEEIRQKIKKIIAKREENENQNIETQEEITNIEK